jgi:hypothetical protein
MFNAVLLDGRLTCAVDMSAWAQLLKTDRQSDKLRGGSVGIERRRWEMVRHHQWLYIHVRSTSRVVGTEYNNRLQLTTWWFVCQSINDDRKRGMEELVADTIRLTPKVFVHVTYPTLYRVHQLQSKTGYRITSDKAERVWNRVLAVHLKVLCHPILSTDGNYDGLRITGLRSETRSSDFPFTKQESSHVACIRF